MAVWFWSHDGSNRHPRLTAQTGRPAAIGLMVQDLGVASWLTWEGSEWEGGEGGGVVLVAYLEQRKYLYFI